jgi:hypothetical protein
MYMCIILTLCCYTHGRHCSCKEFMMLGMCYVTMGLAMAGGNYAPHQRYSPQELQRRARRAGRPKHTAGRYERQEGEDLPHGADEEGADVEDADVEGAADE